MRLCVDGSMPSQKTRRPAKADVLATRWPELRKLVLLAPDADAVDDSPRTADVTASALVPTTEELRGRGR